MPVKKNIGMIMKRLNDIREKGEFQKFLSRQELGALQDAHDILAASFQQYDTKNEIVQNTFATIHWRRADIEDCLKEDGYSDCKENVDKVLEDSELSKNIEKTCIEAGWGAIYARIYDIGDRGLRR